MSELSSPTNTTPAREIYEQQPPVGGLDHEEIVNHLQTKPG